MKSPSPYLLDQLIAYAQECGISYSEAAAIAAEFSKQRAPELAAEIEIRDARYKLQRTVESSPREYFVARFLVRTRVRYISWTYYPEYHVCSEPSDFWWCSIWFEKPTWEPVVRPDRFYIDDLFHDGDEGKFWMREPYLDGLKESAALFQEITKKEFDVLEGTHLRKVDPRVIGPFKSRRVGVSEFTSKFIEEPNVFRRPPYGSKGWQERIKLVPITYKKIRLR